MKVFIKIITVIISVVAILMGIGFIFCGGTIISTKNTTVFFAIIPLYIAWLLISSGAMHIKGVFKKKDADTLNKES